MDNYVGSGDRITVPAPAAVSAGHVVVVNTQLYGVAVADTASASDVVLQRSGVFDLAKVTGTNGSALVGAIAYWYATGNVVTISATSNTKIGVFVKDATSTQTTARVALNPIAL